MATLFEERKRGRKDPDDALYIKQLEPPAEGRRLVADRHKDSPRGFALRVNANGTKVFVLRYNSNGRDRLLTIGEWGTWSLAAARKQAIEYRQQIDIGVDILEQRSEEKAELTVSDVAQRFLKSKKALASYDDIEAALRNHVLPALGKKKIRDIRRRDVITLVEKLAEDRPRQAGLVLTYLKQLFAYAEDREIVEASPVANLKAAKIGQGLTAGKRDRILSNDELKALWQLTEPPSGMHRATLLVLQMILVTGQRPGEVAGMRWSEIDDDLWTIPAARRGKTDDIHTVPLTQSASRILEHAKALGSDTYVFNARGGPIDRAAVAKAVLRCAEAFNMQSPPWRPHDLRRTMRTGLAAAGVSEVVAEVTIGHVRQGIASVYDRHRYDNEKRAALEAWERRLLRITEGKPHSNNVVQLNGADHAS